MPETKRKSVYYREVREEIERLVRCVVAGDRSGFVSGALYALYWQMGKEDSPPSELASKREPPPSSAPAQAPEPPAREPASNAVGASPRRNSIFDDEGL